MKKNIGTTIKKYRLMKNKTQIQLAQDVEISAPGLAAYESGKRVPKIELREQIAKALETDPVALSGLELSENDEIRLLNKLLVKYCLDMSTTSYQKDDITIQEECVQVILPTNFVPLCDKYTEYRKNLELIKTDISCMEIFNAIAHNTDISISDINTDPEILDATEELNYWLETWPQFDYKFQEKNAHDSKRHSFREILHSKFLVGFIEYKDRLKNTSKGN